MKAVELSDKTKKYVAEEDDCNCLVHHPLSPTLRKGLEDIARSRNSSLAVLAAEGLKPCPTREKKVQRAQRLADRRRERAEKKQQAEEG